MKPFLALCAFFLIAGCQSAPEKTEIKTETKTEIKTLYIDSSLADCMGVAPMKCMKVKYPPNDNWTLFYNTIQGFNYEAGYEYTLKVKVSTLSEPHPADAGSLSYQLIDVVKKVR